MQDGVMVSVASTSAKNMTHNQKESVSSKSESKVSWSYRIHQWFIVIACTLIYTINGGIYFTQGMN